MHTPYCAAMANLSDAELSAKGSELSQAIRYHEGLKPRPLIKRYGRNATAEQIASHKAEERAWNSEWRRIRQRHSAYVEQSNARIHAGRSRNGPSHYPAGLLVAIGVAVVAVGAIVAALRPSPVSKAPPKPSTGTARWVDGPAFLPGMSIELIADEAGKAFLFAGLSASLPSVPVRLSSPGGNLAVALNARPLFVLSVSADPRDLMDALVTAFPGAPIVWVPGEASLDMQAVVSSELQAAREAGIHVVGISPTDATGTPAWGASVAGDITNPAGIPAQRRI